MRRRLSCLTLALAFTAFGCEAEKPAAKDAPTASARASGKPGVRKGPKRNKKDKGEEHVVKLRFHLLKAQGSQWLDTSIGKAEVEDWVKGTNEVWKVADVRFELEKSWPKTP
jgi:hypothetical protein